MFVYFFIFLVLHEINHHLQNQITQSRGKSICVQPTIFLCSSWVIIQKRETQPSPTDWQVSAIWGVKFQPFLATYEMWHQIKMKHIYRKPNPQTLITLPWSLGKKKSDIIFMNLWSWQLTNQREFEGRIHKDTIEFLLKYHGPDQFLDTPMKSELTKHYF